MTEINGGIATPLRVDVRLASATSAAGDDLTWMPAWRIRELIGARKLSPVEVMDHFLERIQTLEPKLHAFRGVDVEGAREQARRAEAAVLAGEPLGALHGVPIAVKELIAARGMVWWDSLIARRTLAERDSLEVERLRGAGAVIVGTTVGGLTAYEFGDSDRQPLNPWDTDRVCGDSSSGSACALASGMVPAALAADGLGSTRLPAAYCGLVGLLATRGRVAFADWSQMVNRLISASGPLSRDVRDAAVMLSVLAGPDGRDILGLQDDPPDYLAQLEEGARGMRLVWTDDFGYAGRYARPESARVIETVRRAARRLEAAGAEIEQTEAPFEDPNWACGVMMLSDPGLVIRRDLPPEDIVRARETRGRIWDSFRSVLAGNDFILSPTVQHLAPTRETWGGSWPTPFDWLTPSFMGAYSAHTAAANLLGWPAMSVPAGTVDGMPVGLQIFGRPNSEPRMLQLAQAFLQQS